MLKDIELITKSLILKKKIANKIEDIIKKYKDL